MFINLKINLNRRLEMKKTHLIVFLTLILAIAQSLTSKESYTAENTSSSDDKNAKVDASNEPAQNQKKIPFNPFLPKTEGKGNEREQDQGKTPFNPFLPKTEGKGNERAKNQENPFNPFQSGTEDKGNERAKDQKKIPFNPFLPGTEDKGKVKKSDKTPTEIEKLSSDQNPEIFFDNPDFNFGKIFKGEKVKHIYKFENRGKSILEISKVKSSCGCTAAILTDKNVPPGKTGEIKATFNSGSYRGNVKKNITVTSNDPNSPTYRLSISGEIIEEISAKPHNINFGSISINEETDKTVTITSLTEPGFNIKKITSSKPFVNASIAEQNEAGYNINVALKGNHQIGRFSGNIHMETDSPRQPKVTIPFFGEIIGDITTYPKRIYYGTVTKGKELTQKLFVKINKDDIKISNTKVSPDFLSTKVVEKYEENNPHCLIEIKLHKEAIVGKLNGLLELKTNSKIQPIIKIPIIGEIKKG